MSLNRYLTMVLPAIKSNSLEAFLINNSHTDISAYSYSLHPSSTIICCLIGHYNSTFAFAIAYEIQFLLCHMVQYDSLLYTIQLSAKKQQMSFMYASEHSFRFQSRKVVTRRRSSKLQKSGNTKSILKTPFSRIFCYFLSEGYVK